MAEFQEMAAANLLQHSATKHREMLQRSGRFILFGRVSLILAFIGLIFICITLLRIHGDYYPLILDRGVIISFGVCSFFGILCILYLIWMDHKSNHINMAGHLLAVGAGGVGDQINDQIKRRWMTTFGSFLCNYVFVVGLGSLYFNKKDGDSTIFLTFINVAIQITFFLMMLIVNGLSSKEKEQSSQGSDQC